MSAILDSLPGVWRGAGNRQIRNQKLIPSNIKELDEVLPGGGWPQGALIEILSRRSGLGELKLILPALTGYGLSKDPLTRAETTGHMDGRMNENSGMKAWIAWISPPFLPYAPALVQVGISPARTLLILPGHTGDTASQSRRTRQADVLWATEQALRSGSTEAVLAWFDQCDEKVMRRLQLAAAEGDTLGFLFRPQRHANRPSPAAVRLLVESSSHGRQSVSLLKCRGGRPVKGLVLDSEY